MSAVSDFLTEPTFWWGGLAGSCVTAVIAPIITARSVRASDRRKFAQEDKVLDRKEEREDKLRDEESLYNVAMDYVAVCTDVLDNMVDIKGAFNAIRDMFYNRARTNDPKADEKLDHAIKASEEMKRIMKPYNKMRLIAPPEVIDAAVDVNAAMLAMLRATTEPFAQPVTRKAAGDAIEKFVNVFRAEIGKDMYTATKAQERAISFLANLKQQVHDYMEEAKADMKAAGFKTTPWDQPNASDTESPETDDEDPGPTFLGPTPLATVRSLSVGDDISLPIGRSGRTGTIGLLSTIRGFNDDRTQMTVFVHEPQKTVTLNVSPDQQFIKVPAAGREKSA